MPNWRCKCGGSPVRYLLDDDFKFVVSWFCGSCNYEHFVHHEKWRRQEKWEVEYTSRMQFWNEGKWK